MSCWSEQLRVAPTISLTDEKERELTRLTRSRRTSVRLAQRAQIVLLAAQGLQNKAIAVQLGIGRVQVARWRQRYLEDGLAGIERDLPRGAPPVKVDVARLVELTTQSAPEAVTHWSCRTMGKALGVSSSTVMRHWHANGLEPHLVRGFKISRDPEFAHKLEDIVGLYMALPERTRFHMQFTPTSASWLNVAECFFRDIGESRLRQGVLTSVAEPIAAIKQCIAHHNNNLKPFIWIASAQEKVTRAKTAQLATA